jgi:hypothetical protein
LRTIIVHCVPKPYGYVSLFLSTKPYTSLIAFETLPAALFIDDRIATAIVRLLEQQLWPQLVVLVVSRTGMANNHNKSSSSRLPSLVT